MGVPMTGIYFIYTRMPGCWDYTRKTFPFKSLALTYMTVTLFINAYNISWSLIFEDYCKRGSAIYDVQRRNAKVLRELIRDTNETHKKTVSGKASTSLSD